MEKTRADIICPFCDEDGFDKIGLKHHLLAGHCDAFNKTLSIEQERREINNENLQDNGKSGNQIGYWETSNGSAPS